MLMEWKASAKTGEGIYILQSIADKFMWKLQTMQVNECLSILNKDFIGSHRWCRVISESAL